MKNLIILLMILTLGSCTVHTKSEAEKVVVIGKTFKYIQLSSGDAVYEYKVKRIEKGVVDFITTDYPFDLNDTILYQFWK